MKDEGIPRAWRTEIIGFWRYGKASYIVGMQTWALILMAANFGGLVPITHAKLDRRTFSVETKNIQWIRRKPAFICNELVQAPRFLVIDGGPQKRLVLTFQGIGYPAINLSSDPKKHVFQFAADSDGDSESTMIVIEGEIVDREFSGLAKIEVKKDVSLLKPGQTAKWDKHKYNCKVSYAFRGIRH